MQQNTEKPPKRRGGGGRIASGTSLPADEARRHLGGRIPANVVEVEEVEVMEVVLF